MQEVYKMNLSLASTTLAAEFRQTSDLDEYKNAGSYNILYRNNVARNEVTF